MATIRQLQTLFSKLGVAEAQRHERINARTSGRTQSSKELYDDELQQLCDSLANELVIHKRKSEDAIRLKRSKILTIATRVGIKQPNDWDSFNHFMLYKTAFKKDLKLLTPDELEIVLQQFRALEYHNNKSAEKPGTKAYFSKMGMPHITTN